VSEVQEISSSEVKEYYTKLVEAAWVLNWWWSDIICRGSGGYINQQEQRLLMPKPLSSPSQHIASLFADGGTTASVLNL